MRATKKDFEMAANFVSESKNIIAKGILINFFCSMFESSNPNFDEDRFKEACKKAP